MNKNKILELLKTVNYPGFSRDIVSFGMVDDVSIDGLEALDDTFDNENELLK